MGTGMNNREQSVNAARALIPDGLLVEFFRAIRSHNDVLAAKLINQRLDDGQTLDQIFYTGEDYGFLLSIERLPNSAFGISFSCLAGPLAGDGGEWQVVFDNSGKVRSISGGLLWVS